MFALIGTIIIGFVAGLLARALKPGNDKLGFFWTIVLGVGGSLLAKFIGEALGWYKEGDPVGFIASVVGAIILLFIYGMIRPAKK